MKTLLKASLIATAIASIPSSAFALGAGPINVFSGLGQPLRAEVPLSATPQELQSLSARIAPPDAFRQANIPYSSALSQLRVSVDNSGSKPVLRISSDRPVNEPFIDLLLEFSWDSGRLVREYTFLLDPVALAPAQPASVQTQAPSRVAPAAAARPATVAGGYRVQRGDTLRRIADENRPADVTLDQMLIALARENPAAFDGGNINRMRAGAILNMPSADQVRAIDKSEARREVVAQAADFEAYRRRLAGAAAASPATSDAPAQASEGKITPRVEETAAPASSADRVQVSRAADDGAGATGDAARADRLRALEEDLVARDRALDEANQRLVELERSIRDLQKLIELKSEQLTQLQQQAGTGAPPPAAAGQAPAPAAGTGTATETPAPAAAAPAQTPPAEAPAAVAAPTPAAEAPAAAPAPTPATAPDEAKAEPKKPAPAPKPAPRKPVQPVEPPPQPSFVDELLSDPTMLAAGGGVLALLLGYAGFKLRQRRKPVDGAGLAPNSMSEVPTGPNSVFGVTGGQSVDTSNSSVLQTDFSQSGLSSIDTDEGVDPVAEADVYMAYGRDAQAEEILVDALKADPSRLAIYLKLLELYAARKSATQFETVAADLYSRSGGHGAEWTKAAALGREIDPDNPLYAEDRGDATEAGAQAASKAGAQGTGGMGGAVAAGTAGAAALATGLAGVEKDVVSEPVVEAEQGLDALDFDLPDLEPSAPADVSAASSPVSDAPTSSESETGANQLDDTWAMPEGALAFNDAGSGGESNAEELDTPAVDGNVLDFDLDFEDPSAASKGTGAAPAAGDTEAKSGDANLSATVLAMPGLDDGSMEFDSPSDAGFIDLDAEPAVSGAAKADDLTTTMVAGSDNYGAETQLEGVSGPAGQGGDVVDLEESSFDSNLLDFDFELDSPSATPAGEPPALDLSSIDLELDASQEAQAGGGSGAAADLAADAPAYAGDAGAQEVDTKLELARAYEEMGDKEGARELLDEVLREGDEGQQASARELLARLD